MVIERIYVADIAYHTWEILRLRRCKAGVVNNAIRDALEKILTPVLHEPGTDYSLSERMAISVADDWFTKPAGKKAVRELLKEIQLDESVIEAEAIRRSADDLEFIDRLMTSHEQRRDKALGSIARYRSGFADQLRYASDGMVDGRVLQLEHAPDKKKTSAS